MKVKKWVSGLCFTVMLSNFGVVHAAEDLNLSEKQTVYNQNKDNVLAAREYAVALAQSRNFSESLQIFKQLYQKYPDNREVQLDYIVVLNWAGNNQAAVEMFEKINGDTVPMYVKRSVGGAYYQTGRYKAAQKIFHEIAASGDRKAEMWEAQSLIRMGETEAGNQIYIKLLDKNPDDIDVYLSRASVLVLTNQNTAALNDFEKALSLVPAGDEGIIKRRQINYDMAISYIRVGDEARAILLLKPYIQDGTADVWMQGDYITALRLNADYKTAISEGERLWPDYGKVPNFGLQSLGDSYLRNGQIQKAEVLYQEILKREPDSVNVKLGLAYSYVAQGKMEKGMALYREVLKSDPSRAEVILDDAYDFVAKNRYAAGKSIYGLVVEQFPNIPAFRQELASSLVDNQMPRQAYEQFKALAKLPEGELIGNAGMAETAVMVGDYHAADQAIGTLREKYARSVITQAAVSNYDRRKRGGVDSSYIYSSDYKGVESRQFVVIGEQNIGGSYSVLASIGHNRITDNDTNERSTLKSQSVGMQYLGMKFDTRVWLDHYQHQGNFSGYRIYNNYYFDDHAIVNVNFEKGPVLDVQALNPANAEGFGRIMMSNYTIGFTRLVGLKDVYSFNFSRGLLSDGNRVNTYDLRWDHTMFDNDKKSLDWFIYTNRSNYKYQQINGVDTVYESPTVRQAYGAGLTQRWIIPKGYWEGTATFEWGRDRPEPTDFEPGLRLEYGHNFSPNHLLIVGAEYGGRTNRLVNSSTLHFGSRQYDIRYQVIW
ncbi:MAG: Tetratricopeptide repeat-containing protein [Pelosinus sp.]|jgi:biofilm PGA synthesis protein PgaA|nr:Tetratricopeptide repeat-containing protein [Pelosinus sp.]